MHYGIGGANLAVVHTVLGLDRTQLKDLVVFTVFTLTLAAVEASIHY